MEAAGARLSCARRLERSRMAGRDVTDMFGGYVYRTGERLGRIVLQDGRIR